MLLTLTTTVGVASKAADLTTKRKQTTTQLPSMDRGHACTFARKAFRWYVRWDAFWRGKMGAGVRRPATPQHVCPLSLAKMWQRKARASRRGYQRWVREHTLPLSRSWEHAVHAVQRVFPGTESWLWSCSGAEGSHGHWKPYNAYGDVYYAGYERSDEVGGWMQFRPSTFKGMWRYGYEHARQRGFFVPLRKDDWLAAWLHPLGQAIAAGWARYTGNDNSHWSASWGRGC